jgi:hypothetical protein
VLAGLAAAVVVWAAAVPALALPGRRAGGDDLPGELRPGPERSEAVIRRRVS